MVAELQHTSGIEVSDDGATRHVRVLAEQRGSYLERREFDSPWPAGLLYELDRLKGPWFLDSYQRFEHPNYIQKQVDAVLDLYGITLGNSPILDFGCGFGASSHCMLKRGATNIVAADLVESNTDFAQRFFTEMGTADRVRVVCGDIVASLRPASFGIIWLQAVMEHLLPEERKAYLKRFWTALQPGGVLIVTETPNRRWPIERHTTGGTWFLSWRRPANVFRTMRRDSKYAGYSDEAFYRSGIIGSSYDEVLDCLDRPRDCVELSVRRGGQAAFRYARAARRTPMRSAAVHALGAAEFVSRHCLRRPITAFMPFLDHLAFQKRGKSEAEV